MNQNDDGIVNENTLGGYFTRGKNFNTKVEAEAYDVDFGLVEELAEVTNQIYGKLKDHTLRKFVHRALTTLHTAIDTIE